MLARGAVTPTALVDAALARHRATDAAVRAVPIVRARARARAAATEAGAAPAGLLRGPPVLIRDLSAVEGVRWTAARATTRRASPAIPTGRARDRGRGRIVLGKTNTPEFGAGSHVQRRLRRDAQPALPRPAEPRGGGGGARARADRALGGWIVGRRGRARLRRRLARARLRPRRLAARARELLRRRRRAAEPRARARRARAPARRRDEPSSASTARWRAPSPTRRFSSTRCARRRRRRRRARRRCPAGRSRRRRPRRQRSPRGRATRRARAARVAFSADLGGACSVDGRVAAACAAAVRARSARPSTSPARALTSATRRDVPRAAWRAPSPPTRPSRPRPRRRRRGGGGRRRRRRPHRAAAAARRRRRAGRAARVKPRCAGTSPAAARAARASSRPRGARSAGSSRVSTRSLKAASTSSRVPPRPSRRSSSRRAPVGRQRAGRPRRAAARPLRAAVPRARRRGGRRRRVERRGDAAGDDATGGEEDDLFTPYTEWMRLCYAISLSGCPSVCVPCGLTDARRPRQRAARRAALARGRGARGRRAARGRAPRARRAAAAATATGTARRGRPSAQCARAPRPRWHGLGRDALPS